jgi:hypothetical protein
VAREIGADPTFVIAATHGKRAIDNLARFKPHLLSHEMNAAVEEFERTILFYADACAHRRGARSSTPSLLSNSDFDSESATGNSSVSSLVLSAVASTEQLAATLSIARAGDSSNEWKLEAELDTVEVDRAVRILPGVKALLESIPEGRYAIATSGAKTYGALSSSSSRLPPLWAISPAVSVATELTGAQRMVASAEWVLSRPK